MKKIFCFLTVMLMLIMLVSCSALAPPVQQGDDPFPGKIAIIVSATDQSTEEYNAAEHMVAKYGADKIILRTWPQNFMEEQAKMISLVDELAANKEIKALIINQAVWGTTRAVDKLLETRSDIFIVYCDPAENIQEVLSRANLVIMPNQYADGVSLAHHAKAQGAETFVHYSFPRHMAMFDIAVRRDLIRQTCEELGLQFVDAQAIDPTSEVGIDGARQFVLEDVREKISIYGKDTTFFATNCGLQLPIITAVMEGGAIFTRPCCPSPFHAFPEAFGIETDEGVDDISYVISETSRIVAEHNMTGRVSNWPVPISMLYTTSAVEYAIKWINGDVDDDLIDVSVLSGILDAAVKEATGSDIHVDIAQYGGEGVTHNRVLMLTLGYLNY